MSAGVASTFTVLPAIDLRGGRVVRLERGDFDRETVFADDPGVVARAFAAQGARWIHVVDLDGARDGARRQAGAIERIAAAVREQSVGIQVAGGLRDADGIQAALSSGAARIVLGTVAITAPVVVADAIAHYGSDRVAVALDVRDGRAVGDGWVPGAPSRPATDVLAELTAAGVATVIVTAIERDGLLGGPDLELLERCAGGTPAAVIASGGIRSIDDVVAARAVGCAGAIVGRAVYDGRIDLEAAIGALARADHAAASE